MIIQPSDPLLKEGLRVAGTATRAMLDAEFGIKYLRVWAGSIIYGIRVEI